MNAKPATRKSALKQCACSLFEALGDNGHDELDRDTGCSRMTHRIFAQGHDAKLVAFLVQAELDGLDIRTSEGGVAITHAGAVAAAATISQPLADKAARGLAVAAARTAKKAARKAQKAAKTTTAPAPEPQFVTAKIGRWVYEGVAIGAHTGDACYRNAKGEVKVAKKGSYTVL